MPFQLEEDLLDLPDTPILVSEVANLIKRYQRTPGERIPRSVVIESNDTGFGRSTLIIPLIKGQHDEYELVTHDIHDRFRHGCRTTFSHKLSRMSSRAAQPSTIQHLLDVCGLSGRDVVHVYNESLTLAAVYNRRLCLYFCVRKDS